MSVVAQWSGLSGALMLARGRAEGLLRIPNDSRAAARSFWAAAVCAPVFAGLLILTWRSQGWPPNLPHAATVEALSFIVGWAGYAVISHGMLVMLGGGAKWPKFITVWNWVNVVQYALLLIAMIPAVAGAPGWVSQTTQLVAQGWALWLEWYAIRLVLSASGIQAAIIMSPDIFLGLILAGITAGT